jgi:hypothetical protein
MPLRPAPSCAYACIRRTLPAPTRTHLSITCHRQGDPQAHRGSIFMHLSVEGCSRTPRKSKSYRHCRGECMRACLPLGSACALSFRAKRSHVSRRVIRTAKARLTRSGQQSVLHLPSHKALKRRRLRGVRAHTQASRAQRKARFVTEPVDPAKQFVRLRSFTPFSPTTERPLTPEKKLRKQPRTASYCAEHRYVDSAVKQHSC